VGTLTIAFDITIVGALALPWVLLAIHLLFFEGENRIEEALKWVKEQELQAAAGVLLFALTYTLGSAVSRIARDFFNDDDLYLQVDGELFRVGMTEDRILASVYCDSNSDHLLSAAKGNPALAEKITAFQGEISTGACGRTLRWSERHRYTKTDDNLIKTARDVFGLQENALLLKGEDATLRLRQLHDQIMVLRGAAFNGLIGFSLCLFAYLAALRRDKPGGWVRLAIVPVPAIYLAVALIATLHHFEERLPSDPPYMEFTLTLLGLVGGWLIWKRPSPQSSSPVQAPGTGPERKPVPECEWGKDHWARLVVFSAILTVGVVLGWWSTEVLYGEQVVYSYSSQGTLAGQK
jgi:hypothetical protein